MSRGNEANVTCLIVRFVYKLLVPDFVLAMMDSWVRYMVLMQNFEVDIPKAHMVFHMIRRAGYLGNPMRYAVFLDESLNKNLKNCLRLIHQARFEISAMAHFGRWLMGWNARNNR